VPPRNAARPATVRTVSGPREIRPALAAGSDLVANKSQAKKQDLSSMQAAFLGALVDLAQRETCEAAIAIPTGLVEPGELRQAIVALTCAAKGEVDE
jgi:hypothetical protein